MAARNYPQIPLETLQRAEQLLTAGERWGDVAKDLSVGVFALRSHMAKNGLRTEYPQPRRRTKAEVRAVSAEPKGEGWNQQAANEWLRQPLIGARA